MVGTVVKSGFNVRKTLLANFIAGIGWGIGATVGLALFLSVLTWLFTLLGGIPVVGGWFADFIGVINEELRIRAGGGGT